MLPVIFHLTVGPEEERRRMKELCFEEHVCSDDNNDEQ